jgi:hypothetical protein
MRCGGRSVSRSASRGLARFASRSSGAAKAGAAAAAVRGDLGAGRRLQCRRDLTRPSPSARRTRSSPLPSSLPGTPEVDGLVRSRAPKTGEPRFQDATRLLLMRPNRCLPVRLSATAECGRYPPRPASRRAVTRPPRTARMASQTASSAIVTWPERSGDSGRAANGWRPSLVRR